MKRFFTALLGTIVGAIAAVAITYWLESVIPPSAELRLQCPGGGCRPDLIGSRAWEVVFALLVTAGAWGVRWLFEREPRDRGAMAISGASAYAACVVLFVLPPRGMGIIIALLPISVFFLLFGPIVVLAVTAASLLDRLA